MSSAVAFDAKRMAGQRLKERIFHATTLVAALLVLVLLGGVAVSLAHGAWPALAHFKLAFLTREIWNPVTDQYGALAAIYGTVVTSIIAMLLAVPVSFGIALFLTELCSAMAQAARSASRSSCWRPCPASSSASGACSCSRRCCSVHVAAVADRARSGSLPGDRHALSRAAPYGIGILTAGIVLAIMVVPFIAATMRDVFETVPDVLKESGYGLGATTWEVIWSVVVPYSRTGIVGGVDARPRTRARRDHGGDVRDRQRPSHLALAPGARARPSPSAIANEFTEAVGDLYTSSLIALGAAPVPHHLHGDRRWRGSCCVRLERRALSAV